MDSPASRTEAAWRIEDAEELYRVQAWSDGFFFVNEAGHVAARPGPDESIAIDVAEIVADVRARGVEFPVLLRFQDILQARVRRLNEAFRSARERFEYGNEYRSIYPIKVNQLHEVVEEVLDAGRRYNLGLECGSKAELVAALAHLEQDDTLLICNGVKDNAMLSLMRAGQRLGKRIIPVVEKYGEFPQWMALAGQAPQTPEFGVRVRLTTSGSGRWAESGGDQSKFGISIPELVTLLERLEADGRRDAFVLLHCHLGSQIADISILRDALKELTQVYAKLVRRGIPIRYIDVGGGLGVSYDASDGQADCAIPYSLQEYANAVVSSVREVCDEQQVPHPILLSESGRAITAHHSMLIVECQGAYRKDRIEPEFRPRTEDHALVGKLHRILQRIEKPNRQRPLKVSALVEAYHEIRDIRRDADARFRIGYLPLEQQALVERLYWSTCDALLRRMLAQDPDPMPPEFVELEEDLVEHYLCNFSVFQSMLDHWAIDQVFPIMPIARLDERPDRRAVLVDLTCDSDGKVDRYVSADTDKSFISLHPVREGEPYFLGMFLMGAYQDILGDAHNLFGRVSEVHIYTDDAEPNGYWIEKIIPGIRVQEMLEHVQYFAPDLNRRMNALVRAKIDADAIRPKAGMAILDEYTSAFKRSTYCDLQNGTPPANGEGGGT